MPLPFPNPPSIRMHGSNIVVLGIIYNPIPAFSIVSLIRLSALCESLASDTTSRKRAVQEHTNLGE